MNRWLLTYLVVFCSSFVTVGHAAPAFHASVHKKQPAVQPVSSLVKKAHLLSTSLPQQQPGESFTHPKQVASSCPVISFLAALAADEMAIAAQHLANERKVLSVERVLRDYLLHLFPSHYFW